MHTVYSDGSGTHKDIARAALKTGLDAVIVTDHNVLVSGMDGCEREGKKRVFMLVAEAVYDQARLPQKSHLLVFNATREMATFASDPQSLIDSVRHAEGLSFIAHPYDPECKPIKEVDISWVDWETQGFTGLELWNGLSELKIHGHSFLHILFYAFFPSFLAHQPPKQTLDKWDELLKEGIKLIAIGGADEPASPAPCGAPRRALFSYYFPFK